MNGRKKLIVILILLALVAAISFAGSSLFHVAEINFVGSTHYTYGELLSYSGIPQNANILKLDTDLIKANIESNCHYLVEVKNIERVFPNKVVITLEERAEYAMVEYAPGTYVTLDKKGNMIRMTNENPNLLLIKGAGTLRVFEPSELMMSQQAELMETAIKVYGMVYDTRVNMHITSVDVTDVNSIRLELTGDFDAILGNADKLYEKLTNLNIILQECKNLGKTSGTFNVSVPEYPVFSENNQQ